MRSLRTLVAEFHRPAHLALALSIVTLPLLLVIALQVYQGLSRLPALAQSQDLVAHSFDVITTAQTLKSAVLDAERGLRGYLLTGDLKYLDGYRAGVASTPVLLARLTALASDNASQRRRLGGIAAAIHTKFSQMQRALNAYRESGVAAALTSVRTDRDLDAMHEVETLIGATVTAERLQRAQQLIATAKKDKENAFLALVSACLAFAVMIVGIALAVLTFRRARSFAAERLLTERRLADQLAQAQAVLAQTQKMEALGQLTSGVAHDFNNLLHVIRNALAIMDHRLRTTDVEITQCLAMLKRNVERASSTTSRLLAFSRHQPLAAQASDVNQLITGMCDLLRNSLGGEISLHTKLDGDLWAVSIDRNQLEVALLNLAINARDAMPGGGQLTLTTGNVLLNDAYASLHPDVPAGEYVTVAISDTGVGMTPEVMARAFDPFFTTKEEGRGTGLGLSQVYGFMKQSDGHVRIFSASEQGTTFRLYFPRLAAGQAEGPAESRSVRVRAG